jgi:hypothetical protein
MAAILDAHRVWGEMYNIIFDSHVTEEKGFC